MVVYYPPQKDMLLFDNTSKQQVPKHDFGSATYSSIHQDDIVINLVVNDNNHFLAVVSRHVPFDKYFEERVQDTITNDFLPHIYDTEKLSLVFKGCVAHTSGDKPTHIQYRRRQDKINGTDVLHDTLVQQFQSYNDQVQEHVQVYIFEAQHSWKVIENKQGKVFVIEESEPSNKMSRWYFPPKVLTTTL